MLLICLWFQDTAKVKVLLEIRIKIYLGSISFIHTFIHSVVEYFFIQFQNFFFIFYNLHIFFWTLFLLVIQFLVYIFNWYSLKLFSFLVIMHKLFKLFDSFVLILYFEIIYHISFFIFFELQAYVSLISIS